MCTFCNKKLFLGLLVKRNNYPYARFYALSVRAQTSLLEVDLLLYALHSVVRKKLDVFDCSVGDNKCQIRVLKLLEFLSELNDGVVVRLQKNLLELRFRLIDFLESVSDRCSIRYRDNKRKFETLKKHHTMQDILEMFGLSMTLEHDFIMLGLSVFSAMSMDQIREVIPNQLSPGKINDLLHFAKRQLSMMSVEYEQHLAQLTMKPDLEKALSKVESRGFVFMTGFFPGLKVLVEKIKNKHQVIVIKNIIICDCGGIRLYEYTAFKAYNGTFEKIGIEESDDVVAVHEGYQFPGSLERLKELNNITIELGSQLFKQLKYCLCHSDLNRAQFLGNIEEVILANGAHHPQFANGAEIDWAGLEHSDLKKEYDYLKTLPGYGIDDMSKFCIRHIYASTMAQVLQEQRVLQEQLEQGVVNAGSEK
ncbi:hypothetical protein KBD08_00410 [Candidatus Babeliales bacterium]|nr:hypothetical protein [Candidatus Babeliales bacterium]